MAGVGRPTILYPKPYTLNQVSGVEGTFRFTCENVMRVMRANKV